jgi:hypothetical protein
MSPGHAGLETLPAAPRCSMDGLLLKLIHDVRPGRAFWRLFHSIRDDLERLYWCFSHQPTMGASLGFLEDDAATMSFDGEGGTGVQLWRPGSLSRYAATEFAEEFISLWGIDPSLQDPRKLASQYSTTPWPEMDRFVRQHAQVWLLYTDSTCWEGYARRKNLLQRLRGALEHNSQVEVFDSNSARRGAAYQAAGLSDVWIALHQNPG